MIRSIKTLVLGSFVLAGSLTAGVAHAGRDVYWSVDVQAPGYPVGVGASFSNAPHVVAYPQPVYVAPPVVYVPPPVVYAPRPVYVSPGPGYYYGPPAYYGHRHKHWRGHNHWHHGQHRHHHRGGRDGHR